MSELLAENDASRETPSEAARHFEDVSLAADQVSQTGAEVRLRRAIFVPDQNISFYLFEASSAAAARAAMTPAGLRSDRTAEAVSTDTKPTRFAKG
jgi:hypothetical protein